MNDLDLTGRRTRARERSSDDPQPVADPLLDADDAAAVLKISAYTVRQRARRREIPAIRLGKFWRFRRSSLDAWIAEQERLQR
ncbi:MAG TPA: helix-turn-helix domain-containing protein [Solirubrobacteraceae bacterium]|nr:helix-turn-helix domain-containing protein [Solirubrobacteraceae bacterium]